MVAMGHNRKELTPVQKAFLVAGTFILMVCSGAAAAVVAIRLLMSLGLKYHDNYEYYGQSVARLLIPVAAFVAFVIPGLIVWGLHRTQWRIRLRTLLIGMTVVAVALGLVFSLLR
jgi:hypothetical protein